MRVLVTGAEGFVGWHVVRLFRDRGCKVFLFDVHDVWDRLPPVDVVVSLAATANPKEALRNPAGAYANSTRVMVDTLEFARKVDARVLHVSTNEVYGHKVGLPYGPRGPYAGAKVCQEIICETYPDVPVTIVVTQSLFGERQQPDKLVPTVVRNLLAGERITLQRSGDRWATRPFMHVRNLAEALLLLAEEGNNPFDRRVHVGADEILSVRDAVAVLEAALERRAKITPVEAGDRVGHELNVGSIGCDLYGWRPTYDAITALGDVARWYRDNPRWLELYATSLAGLDSPHPAQAREAARAA